MPDLRNATQTPKLFPSDSHHFPHFSIALFSVCVRLEKIKTRKIKIMGSQSSALIKENNLVFHKIIMVLLLTCTHENNTDDLLPYRVTISGLLP